MAGSVETDGHLPTLPVSSDALAATVATPASAPGPVDAFDAPLGDGAGFGERYEGREVLGAGGMGEVQLMKDKHIGREVAVKVARAATGSRSDQLARFAREARLQGQLEHPSIVPVYDLGRRPDGSVYFTMKRVRGLTLEQILDGLRRQDPSFTSAFSRRRLLGAFVSVCQAVHFAHARGVLHRDLKPGNVMLGDFGEIYVLDWGLGKLIGAPDDAAATVATTSSLPSGSAPSQPRIDPSSAPGPATTSGAVMGTPGYMAPEQIRGEVEALDARTDVYALGAILFEILAGEPLHARQPVAQMLAATLAGVDASPRARKGGADCPPELDTLCVRATSVDPAGRPVDVRGLYEAALRYLDGDRDLARRRELAEEAGKAAEAAAGRAITGHGEDERREALRHAGRALALDPDNVTALGAMVRLLLQPPAQTPAEVTREVAQAQDEDLRATARFGGLAFASWFLFLPLLGLLGVKTWWPVFLWCGLVALASCSNLLSARRRVITTHVYFMNLVFANAAIVFLGPLFGPFVLPPLMTGLNTAAFLLHARESWRVPTFVIGVISALVPMGLEYSGILPRTLFFENDAMVIRSWVIHLPEGATLLAIALSISGGVVIPSIVLVHARIHQTRAEQRLHLTSWHLRQLIPAGARDALVPKTELPEPILVCPVDRHMERKRRARAAATASGRA